MISDSDCIFPDQTLASSVTNYSAVGKYTSKQIATATEALLKTLCAHSFLVPLYRVALSLPNVGAERLQWDVRRLLKILSWNLRDEARDELELLTSRSVSVKAGFIAQGVVEKFEVDSVRQRVVSLKEEDSSDEEEGGEPIDEDLIHDLASFEAFLVESHAFITFQQQLLLFVHPETTDPSSMAIEKTGATDEDALTRTIDGPQDDETKAKLRSLASSNGVFHHVFVAAGFLEPHLEPGRVRLPWGCVSIVEDKEPITNKYAKVRE